MSDQPSAIKHKDLSCGDRLVQLQSPKQQFTVCRDRHLAVKLILATNCRNSAHITL